MIKYGSHVAFLHEGSIRFGFVAAIVQRTNHEGEKTEYVVSSVDADGNADFDTTINNEAHIADLTDSWRKTDALFKLTEEAKPYDWARNKSLEILHPTAPGPLQPEAGAIVQLAGTESKPIPF